MGDNINYSARCKKYVNTYPDFTPVIYSLSTYTTISGKYTQVNISGTNFTSGSTIGYTVVNFGNFINLPINFYGSTNISFIVPIQASPGIYKVQVVNISHPNSLYSNIVPFIVI